MFGIHLISFGIGVIVGVIFHVAIKALWTKFVTKAEKASDSSVVP